MPMWESVHFTLVRCYIHIMHTVIICNRSVSWGKELVYAFCEESEHPKFKMKLNIP